VAAIVLLPLGQPVERGKHCADGDLEQAGLGLAGVRVAAAATATASRRSQGCP